VEDQVLIERAQRGDRAAFEAIVARHQGAIYGYLRARLLQAADAEDLTQEVFLRCYAARARFDTGSLIRPWLIGIARNLLREHLRKLRRRKESAWTELCLELEDLVQRTDEAACPYDDVLAQVPKCLETLGPNAREAIGLHYTGRLRFAEIGQRLRRSEGAIKLLMFRARQSLKYCLDHRPPHAADDRP
jgi:RNA polymerase sigma-70 factor (ECF subfamily)